jgi:hypothetical protein
VRLCIAHIYASASWLFDRDRKAMLGWAHP